MIPKKPPANTMPMIRSNRFGHCVKADGGDFQADPARYRRLAMAALKPLEKPTEAMIDAAHEAVWSDAMWAINSRRRLSGRPSGP